MMLRGCVGEWGGKYQYCYFDRALELKMSLNGCLCYLCVLNLVREAVRKRTGLSQTVCGGCLLVMAGVGDWQAFSRGNQL